MHHKQESLAMLIPYYPTSALIATRHARRLVAKRFLRGLLGATMLICCPGWQQPATAQQRHRNPISLIMATTRLDAVRASTTAA